VYPEVSLIGPVPGVNAVAWQVMAAQTNSPEAATGIFVLLFIFIVKFHKGNPRKNEKSDRYDPNAFRKIGGFVEMLGYSHDVPSGQKRPGAPPNFRKALVLQQRPISKEFPQAACPLAAVRWLFQSLLILFGLRGAA
jgi:hypothetical protein